MTWNSNLYNALKQIQKSKNALISSTKTQSSLKDLPQLLIPREYPPVNCPTWSFPLYFQASSSTSPFLSFSLLNQFYFIFCINGQKRDEPWEYICRHIHKCSQAHNMFRKKAINLKLGWSTIQQLAHNFHFFLFDFYVP